MSFYDSLETNTHSLTAAERRIGSILLSDRAGAPFLRASELAQKAGVHESTVVRFAQKIGYAGYIEMRAALRDDSRDTMDRTIAMRAEGEKFSLAVVINSQIEVLRSLPEKIPQERIDSVVLALMDARRVHVMGHGLLLPTVEFLRAKLSATGLHIDVITQTGRERAQRLAAVGADDLLVVLAFSEEYHRVSEQVKLIERQGTSIVLLTEEDTLLGGNLPEHVLAIPRDRARHGVIVSMTALCYALNYSVLLKRSDDSRHTRDRVQELLDAASDPI
ncbi:MurR/RpiR family transcriptional regulator [Rhodococcoides kyotonense]|uniref:DNA-binding transcriptional regulator, MurR/RpiR family, contains HTH and SIS domains n=1 Tax=Rhodococcoides kyotonense TaxID=398843 RepID=A0A239N376_9NOCA|nr:MurR/RpiR family transcriptional regulator [Rhodococcus kyotonensis]SNT48638.1 DNA-binding transcriptional regulator, MurR/RpiR family, contains HTH and SIS domains [Rhodococcus kyotonensis]